MDHSTFFNYTSLGFSKLEFIIKQRIVCNSDLDFLRRYALYCKEKSAAVPDT